jgi:uncharacterized protein with PIN domain
MGQVKVRLYGELNDFLPPERRGRTVQWALFGTPAAKDVLEAIGVPHPEVGLLLVDGEAAGFSHRLRGGERLAVYPASSSLAAAHPGTLAPPLHPPRFLLDGHLATLASALRLFGFDAEMPVGADDATLARRSAEEDRILLTRDLGLLKRSEVRRGRFVRATDPRVQERELVARYGLLSQMAPFTRCSRCNVPLTDASPEQIERSVPAGVRERQDTYRACPGCERIYWDGSHPARVRERIAAIREALGEDGTAALPEAMDLP